MTPFISVTGIAAPLLRMNVDTDAIIPSKEMRRVSKEGLAEGLFAGWRYQSPDSRDPNPEFILNRPPFDQARILLAGRNFGCGSSREHAVWALKEWGIRVIIASGFGSIFRGNCIRNGVLPIILDDAVIEQIAKSVLDNPSCNLLTADLQEKCVSLGASVWQFDLPARDRQMLLEGLDFIAVTLKHQAAIEAFEARDRLDRPWAGL